MQVVVVMVLGLFGDSVRVVSTLSVGTCPRAICITASVRRLWEPMRDASDLRTPAVVTVKEVVGGERRKRKTNIGMDSFERID